MKKLLFALGIAAAMAALPGCNDDDDQDTWSKYTDWREANNQWLTEMQQRKNADGSAYYKVVVPQWNPATFVLIHYFNDRATTEGNLSPLYTSTVDVRYTGHLYDGQPFDSSSNVTMTSVPGIFRTRINQTISGWAVALSDMRVKDTAEVIVPYGLAYGSTGSGTVIRPYSNLRFNIRLEDIYRYEASPY